MDESRRPDPERPDPEGPGPERPNPGDLGPRGRESLRTGTVAVDEVLDSLEGLDDLSVDEHVAVFERAHQTLRSALDARPEA